MSISPLSTNLISDLTQHRQNPFQQIRQDFQQLASALQSGDLTDAQSAYSSIQKVLSSNSNAGSSGSSTAQNDFAALGQALQSGDLTQAQGAFSQLQTDVQGARQARGSNAAPPVAADQFVPTNSDPAQQVQQDYSQLASSLQSGDLTGAQSAFAALQQALESQSGGATSSSTSNSTDPILNDFNALGQALSSGNLSQAQSAFTQLNGDVQSAEQSTASQSQSLAQALAKAVGGHHHHHHHGGGGAPPAATTTTTDTTGDTTGDTTSSGSANVSVYA